MSKLISTKKAVIAVAFLNLTASTLQARTIPLPQLPRPIPPSLPYPNPQFPPSLPPQPLLKPPLTPYFPEQEIPQSPEVSQQGIIKVKRFVFIGNTVLKPKQLRKAVAPFLDKKNLTFSQLLEVSKTVTQLYADNGYINSEALIPPQNFQSGLGAIVIQIVEGKIGQINISGSYRLRRYIRSRLRLAVSPVFNQNRLLEQLSLLQINPLIKTITADLALTPVLGETTLNVSVAANQTIRTQATLDNNRSPSVGSFEKRIQFSDSNVFGLGDGLNLTYSNTLGSNAGQASYSIPLNPHNTTLQFDYVIVDSSIIERPFNRLNITEADRSYQVTLRQPLLQRANGTSIKELAVGITASRLEGDQRLLGKPFPVSPGADDRGRTRISAVRFFQEWNQRGAQGVLSIRSEFSLGVGALDATIHHTAPDSRFFLWRGQAAWLRRLNRHNLSLLLRTDLQFAARPLSPFEQFTLGGVSTVRGYRQDALLTDNGILGSAELRIPIIANPVNQLLVAPFIDGGYSFNVKGLNPDPNALVGAGLGIEYQVGERLRMRLDYGIPIISIQNNKRTLQENGLYLSVTYSF